MLNGKVSVAVFVSGGGTNLQAIIDSFGGAESKVCKIEVVVSNNPTAFAVGRARHAGIPTVVIDKSGEKLSNEVFENQLRQVLTVYKIDLIVLAGFLYILSDDFCKHYPFRIINVHPSLIPKYCGKGMYGLKVHQAVLDAHETTTGATVHYVNSIPDGGQIISQKTVEVMPDDTPRSLQLRVMEQAERILLPQAVKKVSKLILEGTI